MTTSLQARQACDCVDLPRRRFAALVLAGATLPAWAREGVEVGKPSSLSQLVPAQEIEQAATKQYAELLAQARAKGALAPESDPQVQRLRAIARRLIPFAGMWNDRASRWNWEVNLLESPQINAFCMPGGKIAFFSGILSKLQLQDAEVAAVMGHEMAHALREHAREQLAKNNATSLGLSLGAQLLGLGQLGNVAANLGTQLLSMRFSRSDETEADLVGLELAARAGYDPRAAIELWQKMAQAAQGAPPQWLSSHPSNSTRLKTIRKNLPEVLPLYERAPKPTQHFAPMDRKATKPDTPTRERAR